MYGWYGWDLLSISGMIRHPDSRALRYSYFHCHMYEIAANFSTPALT
jgi:hypothetical protein